MKCSVCNKRFTPSRLTLKRSCAPCKRALEAHRQVRCIGGSAPPTPPHIAEKIPIFAERAQLGLPLFTGRRT